MTPGTLALLAAAGVATGLIGTVLGVGGGVFLVPALVLWMGVDMGGAAAAGLVAVIATSSAAGSVNVRRGTANMRLGLVLETATVGGALCGGVAAAHLPDRAVVGLFGLLLAAVTVLLWRTDSGSEAPPEADAPIGALGGDYHEESTGRRVRYPFRRLPAALGVSFFAGNLSSLLGVGGGIVKVPVLHLFCGMPVKAAAATSNFMIGVTAAAGALVYFGRGAIDLPLSGAVALGVLAGTAAGSHVNRRIGDAAVRRAFALLTAFLALQMLRRAFHG